jgi:hypothetical protein
MGRERNICLAWLSFPLTIASIVAPRAMPFGENRYSFLSKAVMG